MTAHPTPFPRAAVRHTAPRTAGLLALALLACSSLAGCAAMPPAWMVKQGRATMHDHRHFHNGIAEPAATPRALPAAEAPLQLPAGPRGEPLEEALARNGTVAFIVLKDGRVAWERYFNGHRRDSLATSFSVAKSVVSLLLGQAIAEGHVRGVDDPITRYLPELRDRDERFDRVQLRHLLAMRSGIAFQEDYRSPWSDAGTFYLTDDLSAAVRGRLRIETEPDTRFAYSSGDTQLLGMVIERATKQPLARYLEQRLWQPMGAEFPAAWSQDSAKHGVTKAFCCLNARAIDFARLGQLVLDGGRRDGHQILPAGWIDDSLAVREHPGADAATRANVQRPGSPRAAYYTWQWRRMPVAAPGRPLGIRPGPDVYAQGFHGQYVYLVPDKRLVIVRFGSEHGSDFWWPALMQHIGQMN